MKQTILSFRMKGVISDHSWCYGSKKILWIQSVLGPLGGGVQNKIVDFGRPKWHLDS